jgi:hypothetical protein
MAADLLSHEGVSGGRCNPDLSAPTGSWSPPAPSEPSALQSELARQLWPRSAPRNSGPKSAKAPGTLSDPPNERTKALEPNVGTLLYLISLGVVATATAVVFFGLAFFLLAHPDEELIADARDRGIEVALQRADLVSPLNKDAAPFPAQTAPAPSVSPGPSPETHEVLPRASKDTALGSASSADTVANATFGGSAGQGLQGDQATPPRPPELPTRQGPGSVGIAMPEPESIGPEYPDLDLTIVRPRPSVDRNGRGTRSPSQSPHPRLSRPRLRSHLPVSELADAPRHFRSHATDYRAEEQQKPWEVSHRGTRSRRAD